MHTRKLPISGMYRTHTPAHHDGTPRLARESEPPHVPFPTGLLLGLAACLLSSAFIYGTDRLDRADRSVELRRLNDDLRRLRTDLQVHDPRWVLSGDGTAEYPLSLVR